MSAKVLVVMPPQRRLSLVQLLEENGLEVSESGSIREAKEELGRASSYDLVCVDHALPDGSWQDLLPSIVESRQPSEVIVCARCGDEHLWADVLQCGAFDLLVEPYEEREVLRILHSALDTRYMHRLQRLAKPVAS